MKENDSRDLNEAILTGVLGFSFVFFSMKDLFNTDNQGHFIALIFIYIFASIGRIFAVVLESEKINSVCIHYCRIILVPFTVWATTAIIFTEIGMFEIATFLAHYSFIYAEFLILTKTYGLKFKIRSPIILDREKSKKKD